MQIALDLEHPSLGADVMHVESAESKGSRNVRLWENIRKVDLGEKISTFHTCSCVLRGRKTTTGESVPG